MIRKLYKYLKSLLNRKRHLNAKWTVELAVDLEATYSVDLENELAVILAEEIEEEMVKEHGPNWKEEQKMNIDEAFEKMRNKK